MTRHERDQLVSIKLDLVRALWLLDSMIKQAGAEHALEDQVNAALEASRETGDDKRPL